MIMFSRTYFNLDVYVHMIAQSRLDVYVCVHMLTGLD